MLKAADLSSNIVVMGFHALSDLLRVQVLDLLRDRELCVCHRCEALDMSQSKLSFHLKTLKEAKLVRTRQERRWIYYSLDLAQFVVLEQYLAEFRRFNLARFLFDLKPVLRQSNQPSVTTATDSSQS